MSKELLETLNGTNRGEFEHSNKPELKTIRTIKSKSWSGHGDISWNLVVS